MSFSELIVLMVIALILFGPEDLPDVARAVGRVVFEVKKIAGDMTREFQDVVKAPSNVLEKAFEDTVKRHTPQKESKREEGISDTVEKSSSDTPPHTDEAEEELLMYEEDPLSGLPEDMVSYEREDTSR